MMDGLFNFSARFPWLIAGPSYRIFIKLQNQTDMTFDIFGNKYAHGNDI